MAMRVAELMVTLGGWSHSTIHRVMFDSLEKATAEFERIAALLKKRAKGNDVPKFLDVEGENKLTCDFDMVNAVALVDLKKADDAEVGLKDAFPHLIWNK